MCMLSLAAFELPRFIAILTRYLHEIFAFFVCTIYIEDGISGIVNRFATSDISTEVNNPNSLITLITLDISLQVSTVSSNLSMALLWLPLCIRRSYVRCLLYTYISIYESMSCVGW